MAATTTLPDKDGIRVEVASPEANVIARIKMDKEGTDFNYVTSDDGHFGPISFIGHKTTWTIRGPKSVSAKTLGPVPPGHQRYVLCDELGKVAYAFDFATEWIRISAVGHDGKLLL